MLLQLLYFFYVFFLMTRRPPRSTLDRSSAASDVYKRQRQYRPPPDAVNAALSFGYALLQSAALGMVNLVGLDPYLGFFHTIDYNPVSYTHLRAHETVLDIVCRLLLEKKKTKKKQS